MAFVTSPNMGFPVPQVSNEPGPQYATDVNSALFTIDSHNHSPGQGVPLGSQSLNLQSDLSFNINNAINLRTARFTSTTASSGTDIGCVYVRGVDLFYNDLNGNIIPITRTGGLASTSLFVGNISTTAIISANSGVPASSGFIRMDNNTDFVSWRNAANNADDKIFFDSSDNFNIVGSGIKLLTPTLPSSANLLTLNSQGVITGNTAIIAGTISTSGAILSGGGFTCTYNFSGQYIITFNSGFNNIPVVVCGLAFNTSSGGYVYAFNGSNNAFDVNTFNLSQVQTGVDFSFIAYGNRN